MLGVALRRGVFSVVSYLALDSLSSKGRRLFGWCTCRLRLEYQLMLVGILHGGAQKDYDP